MQKALLEQLLANKPAETKSKVSNAFDDVSCNFEFAVSVNMSQVQKHMDEANEKGFIAWCNQDAKSAIIYGAGSVYQDNFTDCMTWLNNIRVKSDVALAHFIANDGEKIIEIKDDDEHVRNIVAGALDKIHQQPATPNEADDASKELPVADAVTAHTLEAKPADEAQRHLERAYAYESRDEFEKALRKCEAAVELTPERAEAHNLRGIVLESLGRKEEALAAYREAIRLEPALQEAQENLQELETELKRSRAYQDTTRPAPTFPEVQRPPEGKAGLAAGEEKPPGPQRLDFIVPRGKIALEGTRLTFRRGRFSSETVSLSLDSLRLVYLFFPTQFKWRLIRPSQYHYQYQDLDALSEDAFSELYAALSQQHRFLMGDFLFVLADFEGHVVTVSWKRLADSGIDLMTELRRHRAVRRERLTRWLQGNPSSTIVSKWAIFRIDVSLNVAGIAWSHRRFIPWDALQDIKIHQHKSPLGDTCQFWFIPAKASGLKEINITGVSAKQTEACLAEFNFWRSPDQEPLPEGTGAEQPGPPTAPSHAGPERTSPLAVVSLVAGIAGWIILPLVGAITAIITGHLARREIRHSEGGLSGKGLAVAGLVLGYGQFAAVALVVMVVLAVALFGRGGETTARPTPQVIATATSDASQATAVAQWAQAEVTAQAAQATAATSSGWPLVVLDTFDTNIHNWPTGTDSGALATVTRSFIDGKYRWEVEAHQRVHTAAWLEAVTVSDFCLTTEIPRTSDPDDNYGVEFRVLDANNRYYFGIYDSRQFAFSLLHEGQWVTLIGLTPTSAIRAGEANRITVIAEDSYFVFLINDQFVAEAEDERLASGTVGLAIELNNAGDKAVFEFDNFELRAPVSPYAPGRAGNSDARQPAYSHAHAYQGPAHSHAHTHRSP